MRLPAGHAIWLALEVAIVLETAIRVNGIYQITPEKPLEFKIQSCSSDQNPMREETMLFFPTNVRYCASVRTTKNGVSYVRDKGKTSYLKPVVHVTIHEIGSPHECEIEYIGYGGEYRISPDLGFYSTCSKPISKYINELALGSENPQFNITMSSCPIHSLPRRYKDYLSCDLVRHRWYELTFHSYIRYEVFHKRKYFQAWSNHSTVFMFKPDNFIERTGNELDWLQRLISLEATQKHCQKVRYLIRVDDAWPLPITVFIDYRIREGNYIKYSQHLGNGTIDQWFSGSFAIRKSDRVQEICVQLVWRGSRNRFRLCRTFLQPGECPFPPSSASLPTFSVLPLLSAFVLPLLHPI
ncbi:unnamed protein product [Bursaphelenchus xylophilus]|uniref:(pine wood nematode) hypothetical protein n=1 Tax=Bursaphelenchus xylophilus TaxID=6326 RepID=A0A1I7S839_BURXY|nr:unnamed protein product [Bursaphelenchus xylophilus]CAG9080613.1 unnamed protein product [Bursaphelenchus xylophilus]